MQQLLPHARTQHAALMHVHANTVAAVVAEVRHGAAAACSVAAQSWRTSDITVMLQRMHQLQQSML